MQNCYPCWEKFAQRSCSSIPQTRKDRANVRQTHPTPASIKQGSDFSCVRGAGLLEALEALMEKGNTLSLNTFLMTLRQEWLYPNPTEKQECYRQCFKYLMFTQHSEYKWQFKEKGTPVSVSPSGSFLVCFSAGLMPPHPDDKWQQGMCPVCPKNTCPAPLHRALAAREAGKKW